MDLYICNYAAFSDYVIIQFYHNYKGILITLPHCKSSCFAALVHRVCHTGD